LPSGSPSDATRTIAPCSEENIANPDFTPAPSLYGLWMFSPEVGNVEATQLPLTIATDTAVVTEIVALELRARPANPSSTVDLSNTALIAGNYGVMHIRSVYDTDGNDTSPNGIINMANPLAVAVSQRPARFLRVVKSVSVPDEDTLDIDNQIFGRSRAQLFREIVGYTPIQPDGSVKVALPAGIPFAISVVDAQGKRISPRHNNWLQLVAGEQQSCIGCHASNSTQPHGRTNAQPASLNQGALINGPFPNTNTSLVSVSGESMAQTYARIMGTPQLTANIEFEDVWNNDALGTPAPSFSYAYEDLDTPLPISQSCAQNWSALCRAVINYPQHIAPIFTLPRVSVDEAQNVIANNTCVSCHSPSDESGVLRVPAGQLDLRDTPALQEPAFSTSYFQLMFTRNQQELVQGTLLDTVVAVLDENGDPAFLRDENGELVPDAQGNPIPLTTTVAISPSMSVNGANASSRFFTSFAPNNTHANMLSAAELRLMSEWLDIGGQYYNNPFDAPQE
jgi:hypothetical protein